MRLPRACEVRPLSVHKRVQYLLQLINDAGEIRLGQSYHPALAGWLYLGRHDVDQIAVRCVRLDRCERRRVSDALHAALSGHIKNSAKITSRLHGASGISPNRIWFSLYALLHSESGDFSRSEYLRAQALG